MPVRKIPKNYLSTTGIFSSRKNGRSLGFESLLERDLMILLEFDDSVRAFEEQPIRIQYGEKPKKTYVPDILIHYYPSTSNGIGRTVLGEVKSSEDLAKNADKYAPKFAAALNLTNERGWEWQVFSEKEIRTPYLENLKFLREYHNIKPDAHLLREVGAYIEGAREEMTVEALFKGMCKSDERTLLIAPAVWNMVATKMLVVDLQEPLSLQSLLSLPS